MIRNFWKVVNDVIQEANIVLEVADARFPVLSRNAEIEMKVRKLGKKLLVVFNKCDLISKDKMAVIKKNVDHSVFISSTDNLGTTILRKKLMAMCKGQMKVAVVGYPNTGKSSMINVLKGSAAAGRSSSSGYTKGKQLVRISPRIMLVDTPGVIPFESKDKVLLAMLGSINPGNLKEPEDVAEEILDYICDNSSSAIKKVYGVECGENLLERIALAKNRLRKGGEADVKTMSRIIIKDWQTGKIVL